MLLSGYPTYMWISRFYLLKLPVYNMVHTSCLCILAVCETRLSLMIAGLNVRG